MKKNSLQNKPTPTEVLLARKAFFLPAGVKAMLSLLVAHKNASRLVLERLSSLSRATIVQWLGVLLAARIVQETDETQASGGSPSRLLKLNEDFSLMIAVDIGERLTRVALTSLAPQTLLEMSFPTDLEKPPKAVLSAIMAPLRHYSRGLAAPRVRCSGWV